MPLGVADGVGVADGRDGMAVAEDRRQEPRLRDVGVLVLVQQDRAEPMPDLRHDLRVPLGDLERQLDLVPEVDHAQVALQLPEQADGPRELDPLRRGCERTRRADVLERRQPRLAERDDLLGPDAVVRRLIVEREDLGVRHVRGRVRRGVDLAE